MEGSEGTVHPALVAPLGPETVDYRLTCATNPTTATPIHSTMAQMEVLSSVMGKVHSGGNGSDAVCPRFERPEGSGATGGTIQGERRRWRVWGHRIRIRYLHSEPRRDRRLPGSAGNAGADGSGGNGANATLGNPDLHWSGNRGGDGSDGLPGGGGGGGGAAAGVDIIVNNPDRVIIGASGGGGGAGGCQGSRGLGGNSGGGSFGIFVVFDAITPNSSDDYPTLTENVIWRGLGGRGGSGGKGGAGGEGGLGGLGGPKGQGSLGGYAFCSLTAGEGAVPVGVVDTLAEAVVVKVK